MLDPVTALSTAAAIIQLVDFASRITKESYSLISGAREFPEKHDSLMSSSDADSQLCADLLESLNASRPLNHDEAFLSRVVENYLKKVGALRSLLDAFVVPQSADGSRSWRKQILVAMKSEFKKEKVKDLAKEVEDTRDQLSNAFLYLLRREESLRHDELTACIVRYGVSHADTLSLLKSEILNELTKQQQQLQDHQNRSHALHGSTNKGLDEVQQRLAALSVGTSQKLDALIAGQQRLTHTIGRMTTLKRCETLLEGLYFAGVYRRKTAISEHADETFDWLYDAEASPFCNNSQDDGLRQHHGGDDVRRLQQSDMLYNL